VPWLSARLVGRYQMTTKPIQQRAEELHVEIFSMGVNVPLKAVEVIYTAGATDERRELGKITLRLADRLSFYGEHEIDGILARQELDYNAELIARLREELK
jgi:hypothetical protein